MMGNYGRRNEKVYAYTIVNIAFEYQKLPVRVNSNFLPVVAVVCSERVLSPNPNRFLIFR